MTSEFVFTDTQNYAFLIAKTDSCKQAKLIIMNLCTFTVSHKVSHALGLHLSAALLMALHNPGYLTHSCRMSSYISRTVVSISAAERGQTQ